MTLISHILNATLPPNPARRQHGASVAFEYSKYAWLIREQSNATAAGDLPYALDCSRAAARYEVSKHTLERLRRLVEETPTPTPAT
jgi:hypothetical protein